MNETLRIALVTVLAASAALLSLAGKAPHEQNATIERGKYLVQFAGCNDCHTPLKFSANGPEPDFSRMLSGHPEEMKLPSPNLTPGPWFAATAGMTAWAGPWGITYAANLTPDINTGIGIWTEEMFLKAMKTGKHMGSGRDILPPMPWQNFSHLQDADVKAIFAYLKSIPPVRNHVPEPVAPSGKPAYE
jgi:mono/diheme cytochrome c family protein